MKPIRPALSSALLTALVAAPPAAAQCETWADQLRLPGTDSRVLTQYVWDDGSGPALYLGGWFLAAGSAKASRVARWDGSSWSALAGPSGEGVGLSIQNWVECLAAYDDGSGPALYVGGRFTVAGGLSGTNDVARWDGSSWSALGSGLGPTNMNGREAAALAVYDDGSGPGLYVGGAFFDAGGVSAQHLARWDGAWSAVPGPVFGHWVEDLLTWDDGTGEKLYAGGSFATPGNRIAAFDGTSWSTLGSGTNGKAVYSLLVFDDGGGEALFAGGAFDTMNGVAAKRVARWDGSAWSALGSGPDFDEVHDLFAFDDGTGERLYAVGLYTLGYPGSGQRHVARWEGSAWVEVGDGVDDDAYSLAAFDDGSGPALYVGGAFRAAGPATALNLARWDGASLSPVVAGAGSLNPMEAAVEYDDGGGAVLVAAPTLSPGDRRIMSWDGTSWAALGASPDGIVVDLHVHPGTGGPELYAGGRFQQIGATVVNGIARWDGTAWQPLGSGLGFGAAKPWAEALESHDLGSGPVLVVGGRFFDAGGVQADYIATWDGSAWAPLGGGMDDRVRALAIYDGGSGPELHAGGHFEWIEGNNIRHVAVWKGANWAPLLGGTNADVFALEVFDAGSGPRLWAGGKFTAAFGVQTRYVASWDGSVWHGVAPSGPALDDDVYALAGHDGELWAGGKFSKSRGGPADHVARWNGTQWVEPEGGGATTDVLALAVHDDGQGAGPSLFAFGDFTAIGAVAAGHVARYQKDCPCPPVAYCTAKVNSQGCTPTIFATGTPSISANSLRVKASNVLNNKSGLMFWGLAEKAAPFQGGTLCVQAPTRRTPIQSSFGNPPPDDCTGVYSFHFNKSYINSKGLAAGDTVYAQYWSRDPTSSFTVNLTDALEFLICP